MDAALTSLSASLVELTVLRTYNSGLLGTRWTGITHQKNAPLQGNFLEPRSYATVVISHNTINQLGGTLHSIQSQVIRPHTISHMGLCESGISTIQW